MLCMPLMKARSNNRMLMMNHFLQCKVIMVLKPRILMSEENATYALMLLMAVVSHLRLLAVVLFPETKVKTTENQEKLCDFWAV